MGKKRVTQVFKHYDVMETQKGINRKNRFKKIGTCQKVPALRSAPFEFKPIASTVTTTRDTAYGLKFVPRFDRLGA